MLQGPSGILVEVKDLLKLSCKVPASASENKYIFCIDALFLLVLCQDKLLF